MVDRRVHEGTLGCPNCRDSFTVHAGFTDLRAPPRGEMEAGLAGEDPAPDSASGEAPDTAEAERVTALLAISRGPGTVALVGSPARHARYLVEHVTDLDAVVVDADAAAWSEHPSISRVVSWPGLPLFSGMFRGAVVDGGLGKALLFEAARVVAPRCRVVVVEADGDAPGVLEEAGLTVMAYEAETVVAARG
jgi:hypothetical protein